MSISYVFPIQTVLSKLLKNSMAIWFFDRNYWWTLITSRLMRNINEILIGIPGRKSLANSYLLITITIGLDMPGPSPPGTFHILIGKFFYFVIRFLNLIFFIIIFSYFIIRFLLNSSMVKSDNEIGKVNDKKNMI